MNYPLFVLVSDDNVNIRNACKFVYPNSSTQLCQNHFKQNIRKTLNIKDNTQYKPVMKKIKKLFSIKRSDDDFNRFAKNIFNEYKHDPLVLGIMLDIHKNKELLLAWQNLRRVPTTNNLIECFNSHLNGRLKTIKKFESFQHADLWLNAYFLRRRTKKFTSCIKKFNRLNGKTSLQVTASNPKNLPIIF